jgi:hypothetical protein
MTDTASWAPIAGVLLVGHVVKRLGSKLTHYNVSIRTGFVGVEGCRTARKPHGAQVMEHSVDYKSLTVLKSEGGTCPVYRLLGT